MGSEFFVKRSSLALFFRFFSSERSVAGIDFKKMRLMNRKKSRIIFKKLRLNIGNRESVLDG